MIDRQQLESILQRRFPGATLEQIAAAANAILSLEKAERPAAALGDGRLAPALPQGRTS